MTGVLAPQQIESAVAAFLEHGLAGRSRPAVRVALGLLDRGVSTQSVVRDLLACVQREVGRRWADGSLSVADEHLVTGSVEAALHALAMAGTKEQADGQVLLTCAEGEWHGIAAHMFAVQLEAAGIAVRFLGASTPADHVARLLQRQPADALLVSCTMPVHVAGAAPLVEAAHVSGVPVLVGGGALQDGEAVHQLGGDAWAPDVAAALVVLQEWRERPPYGVTPNTSQRVSRTPAS